MRAWLFAMVITALLAGCAAKDRNVFYPVPGCTDAMSCTDIITTQVLGCGRSIGSDGSIYDESFGTMRGDVSDAYKTLYNFNPSRDVVAVVRLTVTTVGVSRTRDDPYLLKARPKTIPRVSGGKPNGVDAGGVGRPLGCQFGRDTNSPVLSQYEWQVLSACYVDDSGCPTTAMPAKPEASADLLGRCESACESGDPSICLTNRVNRPASDVLASAYREIGVRAWPSGFDLVAVLAAANLPTKCEARQFTIDKAGMGAASGNACLEFYTPYLARSFALELPSLIKSTVTRPQVVGGHAIINFHADATPVLYETDDQDRLLKSDPMAQFSISSRDVLLAGRGFCVRTTYNE